MAKQIKYPADARRAGAQGDVWVQYVIDEYGEIYEVSIYRSSGHVLLDLEAVNTVKNVVSKYKWTPAVIQGKPVKFRNPPMPVKFRVQMKGGRF